MTNIQIIKQISNEKEEKQFKSGRGPSDFELVFGESAEPRARGASVLQFGFERNEGIVGAIKSRIGGK